MLSALVGATTAKAYRVSRSDTLRDMSSIFSRIVAGEIPCHKVWEDDDHLAFLDMRPKTPGHTLVIPKRELAYVFDMDADAHAALWRAARTVARHLRERLGCQRVCVAVVGYEVPHVHVHLIPTNAIEDFGWSGGTPAEQDDLATMAARLA